MKRCSKCKRELDESEFYKNRSKKDGLQNMCKRCSHRRRTRHYKENREKENSRRRERARELREWFVEHKKGLSCSRCPEDRWYVLEFHHRHSKDKEVSVMVADSYSRERILKEIEKCDVLCANCHKEVHYLES